MFYDIGPSLKVSLTAAKNNSEISYIYLGTLGSTVTTNKFVSIYQWCAFQGARCQFVKQKLMLSSNFRCYQNHYCQRYDLGHSLLCYLSPT